MLAWCFQAQVAQAHRRQLQAAQATLVVEFGEVQQSQFAAKAFVALDAFVVVDQIAAAVEDQPPVMDLEALGVVGGVAVDPVNAGLVDQAVGEAPLFFGDDVAPVAAGRDRRQYGAGRDAPGG